MNKCITRTSVCTILSVLICQYDMFMLRKTFVKKQMPTIVQGILRRNVNKDIGSKQDYDSLQLDDHFAKVFVPKGLKYGTNHEKYFSLSSYLAQKQDELSDSDTSLTTHQPFQCLNDFSETISDISRYKFMLTNGYVSL